MFYKARDFKNFRLYFDFHARFIFDLISVLILIN